MLLQIIYLFINNIPKVISYLKILLLDNNAKIYRNINKCLDNANKLYFDLNNIYKWYYMYT